MNDQQRKVIIAMIVVILLMLAFPPFQVKIANVTYNMGYESIFSPPVKVKGWNRVEATVDVFMLMVQWMGVLIAGGLGVFLTRRPHSADGGSIKSDASETNNIVAKVQPTEGVSQPKRRLLSISIGILRIFRGIFGLVFVLQVIGLLPGLGWLIQPESITNELLGFFLIKLVVLVLSGVLFHWLRSVINNLHKKKIGDKQLTLIKTAWAL